MHADEIVRALLCQDEYADDDYAWSEDLHHDAADLIESLQAQLTTTQKRLEAAEKDITALGNESCESCKLCRKCPCCKPGERGVCKGFEWRGPQEAEKGEAE
jgi:hypothetical protein